MEDRCVACGTDVSDQSRHYCLNCERKIDNMNQKKTEELRYQIRRRKYIRWINEKPPKWKFISYIKWLNKRPPRP